MAYTKIASSTVTGGSTNTVTFSSIPQTYKDLVLFSCLRLTSTAQILGSFTIHFNGSSSSQSEKRLTSNNNTVSGDTVTSDPSFYIRGTTNFGSANAFGSSITTIADYTNVSYAKTHNSRSIAINNSTAASGGYVFITNGRWASGSAITSMDLVREGSGSDYFLAGTTFDLYGVI